MIHVPYDLASYDEGILEERKRNVAMLRRRAESYRMQECNTAAHRDRCDHAAAVLDQVAEEIEGDIES